MIPTRFTIERDVARYALAFPAGAVEAWDTGEIFQDRVTSDVLAASLAACVVFIAKPLAEQAEMTLLRLTKAALQDVDAWTSSWSDELDWYSPVWGPREVAWAVGEGFAGFGGFDHRKWSDSLMEFFHVACRVGVE